MPSKPIIVLFRRDLRLTDNPALTAAAERGAVIPLFVLDDSEPEIPIGASIWWLNQTLFALQNALEKAGSALVLRRGETTAVAHSLVRETDAGAVFWNRRYTPAGMDADRALKASLTDAGIEARSFHGSLLLEPWNLQSKTGNPYRVFRPFWNALCAVGPSRAATAARLSRLTPPARPVESDQLAEWGLRPTNPDWSEKFDSYWVPGEEGAQEALRAFLADGAERYSEARDRPGIEGTSRLSPHLAFGEIAPVAIWRAARAMTGSDEKSNRFLSELGWREFSHHLFYHFPDMKTAPLRPEFADFPWADDDNAFRAWKRGMTGYPIVDAGMRELWNTGWMHNRVRMIVASFLVKDLLIPWRRGEEWFWRTLVDADPASNSANWQWVAGCGADAAPYFRIFNPVTQGERFDPDGTYVRRFVPELAAMPKKYVHRPWDASADLLEKAGVRLGTDYPQPMVDHRRARRLALQAFATIKKR